MAETLSAVERILKISVFSFHSRVAAFAQCNQIVKLVSFLPIRKIMEAYNMVDFKTLFSRFLAATVALIIVPFPGKPCLLFPIGSIIRLIATFPTRMSFWCFPHPIIPAFSRAKAKSRILFFASSRISLPTMLTYSLISFTQLWIRLTLSGSRYFSSVFKRLTSPFHCVSSVVAKPTVLAVLTSAIPPSYMRRKYINRFTAIKTIIVNAPFHNLIISCREDK